MDKLNDQARSNLIFCECKTNNSFKDHDKTRMKELATEFPKATIVFSTMKSELSDSEKLLLSDMFGSVAILDKSMEIKHNLTS
ncbi:hypothetical protein D3C73_864680 [compost metagenome]